MNLKKKTFEIPFIGYDYGKDNKWNFDALIGQFGNPIIGIQIKNNVEQYSADPDAYLQFHTILNSQGLLRPFEFIHKSLIVSALLFSQLVRQKQDKYQIFCK